MWRKELSHPGEGLCPETNLPTNCSGSYGHQLPSFFFVVFVLKGETCMAWESQRVEVHIVCLSAAHTAPQGCFGLHCV